MIHSPVATGSTAGNHEPNPGVDHGMTERQPVRIVSNPKWIRGSLNGKHIVDSRASLLVWEHQYYPAWYFPLADLNAELRQNGSAEPTPNRGDATPYDIVVGDTVLPGAARRHLDSEQLADFVHIEWDALDAWFEEDVEVFVHPRSPEVRIDALASSRHIKVSVDGTVVADSTSATLLFETNLPTRFYLPKVDVRMDLLRGTNTESACPYKGFAHYWSVVVDGATNPDLAWGYRTPLPESEALAGLVCFYNEKVDIEIDGIAQERPNTKFA